MAKNRDFIDKIQQQSEKIIDKDEKIDYLQQTNQILESDKDYLKKQYDGMF